MGRDREPRHPDHGECDSRGAAELMRILAGHGFTCTQAAEARRPWSASGGAGDLVLCDIKMPAWTDCPCEGLARAFRKWPS